MVPKETTDTEGSFTQTSRISKQFSLVRYAQQSKLLFVHMKYSVTQRVSVVERKKSYKQCHSKVIT
jgi:hypothetical protein